ncbi:MAG: sulfurtransferase [Candidatus Aminicenantes bacterium]|nr:MAG: sulfurtransferase [Candidatus Aminicenantes bacterium]
MHSRPSQISTEELYEQSGKPGFQLIDIRSVDAYNGWRLRNEARGGHIEGAKSLPFKWTDYIDWIEIVRSKNILPDDSLVLYGYDNSETTKVAHLFNRAGYEDVRTYHSFVDEWAANDKHPMQKLSNYRQLVSAEWLNELILTGIAPEHDNDKFVLCHAYYHDRKAYERGHIPGAIDLDTNLLESPETWNRRSPEEIRKALENLGITHDTTVILYGRFSNPDINDPFPGSSAGHLGAFRCAFIMMYAGVEDVRMLNGGLQAWMDDGFEVSKEETVKAHVSDFGAAIPACPELAVDILEAKEILKSENKNLVSVRSWREFIGEESGYNYIEKRGRIPAAVFGNCGSDAYHMENYRNLDHTTREFHEIEKMWAEVGITSDKHNAFYCGTGWRGSEAFFNAWLMGWPQVSVFDGGWFEWSNDDNNPYETGIP